MKEYGIFRGGSGECSEKEMKLLGGANNKKNEAFFFFFFFLERGERKEKTLLDSLLVFLAKLFSFFFLFFNLSLSLSSTSSPIPRVIIFYAQRARDTA